MLARTSNPGLELRTQYDRDGQVTARGVIDRELVREGQAHVEWLLKRHPDTRPEQLHANLVEHDPFWVRLISDPRLLDVAERFVGPNIALFASHYIAKPPRDGQQVLWHQDASYWPLEPMEVVTLWLALDDADADNGCMRIIPGTQHERLQPLQERKDVPNVLQSGLDETGIDVSRAVDVVLKAGDVSIHHPNLVHGSNANTSDRWRRGLTIRYIPTSTRITVMPFPSCFLLRGSAVPGVNTYNPKPSYRPGEHLEFGGHDAWNAAPDVTSAARAVHLQRRLTVPGLTD